MRMTELKYTCTGVKMELYSYRTKIPVLDNTDYKVQSYELGVGQ